jgi:hypothetical protein
MLGVRTVDELINLAEPAWPELETLLTACPDAEVLAIEPADGRRCLYAIQVTTRSRMGAMALHCGGVVLDYGWLRIYGGGCSERGLASLADANGLTGADHDVLPSFAVGHDVLGGRFELNGPSPVRPGEPGELCYLAPDTLEWEPLGMGYGDWLSWLASGATAQFYESMRWPGWEDEITALRLDQGISMYPFLCTAQARADLSATSRKAVPIAEVLGVHAELAAQIGDLPDGSSFIVRVKE